MTKPFDIDENTDDSNVILYGKTVKVKSTFVGYNIPQESVVPQSFKTQLTSLINDNEMVLVISIRPNLVEFENIQSIVSYSFEFLSKGRIVYASIKRANLKEHFFEEDVNNFRLVCQQHCDI